MTPTDQYDSATVRPPVGPRAADTHDHIAHFRARLRFETDPSDLYSDLESGADIVVIDSRGDAAWDQGRLPRAIHLPTARIRAEATAVIPAGKPVVVYCWSPGCNGGTKAALALAELGYEVKEMIGGFEYWAREGFPVATDAGVIRYAADPLTAPVSTPPKTGATCALPLADAGTSAGAGAGAAACGC